MNTYRLTITTSTTESSLVGESTPAAAADGRQRVVWSGDDVGRGVSVTIKPLHADSQFVLHGLRVYVVPSSSGPEDA